MLPFQIGPALSIAVLWAGATLVGVAPVKKLIQVDEARHELKRGSAGAIRSFSGWSIIAFWLLITWYMASVLGDWAVSGDLGGAVDRSWLRLRIIIEILSAIADSDN